MKTKTYDMKKNAKYRFAIGTIALVAGIILTFTNPNLKFGEIILPNTIITIGIIMIAIGIRGYFFIKEIKYDERTQLLLLKSSRATLTTIIYTTLTTMLIGTIQKIQIDLMTTSAIILFATIILHKLFYLHYNKKE